MEGRRGHMIDLKDISVEIIEELKSMSDEKFKKLLEEKLLPEVIMHYNVQDNRYYIYLGEDYVDDTQDEERALHIFKEQCIMLKDLYL
jgi:hypothetical protein